MISWELLTRPTCLSNQASCKKQRGPPILLCHYLNVGSTRVKVVFSRFFLLLFFKKIYRIFWTIPSGSYSLSGECSCSGEQFTFLPSDVTSWEWFKCLLDLLRSQDDTYFTYSADSNTLRCFQFPRDTVKTFQVCCVLSVRQKRTERRCNLVFLNEGNVFDFIIQLLSSHPPSEDNDTDQMFQLSGCWRSCFPIPVQCQSIMFHMYFYGVTRVEMETSSSNSRSSQFITVK